MKLIIDRFDFTNAKASVSSDVLGEFSITVPDIHLSDVGRASGGATIGEVIQQLLDPVYKSVSREMIAQGLDLDVEGLTARAEENIKGAVSDELVGRLKGITGKIGRAE